MPLCHNVCNPVLPSVDTHLLHTQPVVKPTPSLMSSMRAIWAARTSSHLQSSVMSRYKVCDSCYIVCINVRKYLERISSVCLFFLAGGHDAQDTPPVPPDSGQRAVGGCHEPGPQLHHIHLDFLPPGR